MDYIVSRANLQKLTRLAGDVEWARKSGVKEYEDAQAEFEAQLLVCLERPVKEEEKEK